MLMYFAPSSNPNEAEFDPEEDEPTLEYCLVFQLKNKNDSSSHRFIYESELHNGIAELL